MMPFALLAHHTLSQPTWLRAAPPGLLATVLAIGRADPARARRCGCPPIETLAAELRRREGSDRPPDEGTQIG